MQYESDPLASTALGRNVDFCSVCAADPDHLLLTRHRVVEFKDALKPSQETDFHLLSGVTATNCSWITRY